MKDNSFVNQKNQIPFWKTLVALIMFLLISKPIFAQDVIVPAGNTPTNIQNLPLGRVTGDFYATSMIYTAAELGLATGTKINSLAFYAVNISSNAFATLASVSISNTTQTNFVAQSFLLENLNPEYLTIGNFNFSGPIGQSSWVSTTLSSPFTYTGGNLKVSIEIIGGIVDNSPTDKEFFWSPGAAQVWFGTTPATNGDVYTIRPNIKFGIDNTPPNDTCSTAIGVEFLPFTNVQTQAQFATNNAGFLQCTNPMNDGVWYTFYGTGGPMKVAVSGVEATFDPQLDVYVGSCTGVGLACVDSVDNGANGIGETAAFATVSNTQYFVNVGHFSGTQDLPEGNFTIKITDERPSKFDFNSELNYGYENQSINITVSRNRGSNGVSSVSYAPNDGSALGNIDYGSALGTLTWADGDNSLKTITIQLLPDVIAEGLETFNLLLINPTNGATTDFNETIVTIIDTTSPPVNDACSGALNAVTLPYSNVQVRGEATSNNAGFLSCGLSGMNDGVWYSFTGNGSNITVAVTNVDILFDPQIDIYDGICNAGLGCVASADSGLNGGDNETVTFLSTLGANYFVNVGNWNGTFDAPEGNFKIDITTTALANNQFEFSNLKVYPNPVNNILNVENSEKITKVSIINLLGQELLSKNFDDLKTQIDISEIQSGSYLVRISSENKEQIVKIVKN